MARVKALDLARARAAKEKERLRKLKAKEAARAKAAREKDKARKAVIAAREKAAKEKERTRLKAAKERMRSRKALEAQRKRERAAKEKLRFKAAREKQRERERIAREKAKAKELAAREKAKAKELAALEKAKAKEAALLAKQKEKELKAQLKQQAQELLKLRKAGRPRRNGDAERALLLRAEARPEDAEARRTRLKHLIQAISACPTTIAEIIDLAGKVARDEMRIDELVDGLIDPNAKDEPIQELADDVEPEEEEETDGEDESAALSASLLQLKEDALARFAKISRLYEKMKRALVEHGHRSKEYIRVRDQ